MQQECYCSGISSQLHIAILKTLKHMTLYDWLGKKIKVDLCVSLHDVEKKLTYPWSLFSFIYS